MDIGTLETVSNRADWVDDFVYRDENNALVDLSSASILMELRDREKRTSVLTASTANGRIAVTGTGTFRVTVPAASMHSICPETYDVGITITISGAVSQPFIGTIPVLDGVVS